MIETERQGDVWIVRMRDGENRFNRQTLEEFHQALDRAETAAAPVALVTTGEGKFYSNGIDLDWLAGASGEAAEYAASLHRLLGRMIGFPAVTVAAVNGHAFGAGAMLAIAHDFAVMREDRGYWCLPEADLGLPLAPAMYGVISAKLPRRAAHEAIITARRYGGRDAVAAGIAHRAASEDQVLAQAVQLAAELAGKDRGTLAVHKRLMYGEVMEACGVTAGGPAGAAGTSAVGQ
jgi:Delta3-Delta2-enoyl-CoA isomerase